MAIVNRDLDASQQKDVLHYKAGAAVATGATLSAGVIPYPCSLQSVAAFAIGVSNAMQLAFNANRWTAAGLTSIALGVSNLVLQNYSVSGILGFSGLAVPGSTLLNLQQGDVLTVVSSVSNGNALDIVLEFALKKAQDIVAHNNNAS